MSVLWEVLTKEQLISPTMWTITNASVPYKLAIASFLEYRIHLSLSFGDKCDYIHKFPVQARTKKNLKINFIEHSNGCHEKQNHNLEYDWVSRRIIAVTQYKLFLVRNEADADYEKENLHSQRSKADR